MIGSQLWWNWEVDTTRYHGWQQLINDLGAKNINVMTYCNPCLAPVFFFFQELMVLLL
jgi:alpha-glucosidase (family GH31 glycosyl hydrolase)